MSVTPRLDYHLAERRIAFDPSHPKHFLPPSLPPSTTILDVGCGAGQTLLAAYPDCPTFGADLDLQALRLGRSFSPPLHLANARAEALPFKSAHFGFVFSRVSLPYTNIPAALSEIRRVLSDSGSLWLTLHPLSIPWRERTNTLKDTVWFLYVLTNGLLFHCFQKVIPLRGRYESFQTSYGIRRALLAAGFHNIRISRGPHFLVTAQASPHVPA